MKAVMPTNKPNKDDLMRLKINTKFVLQMINDATPHTAEEHQQLEDLRFWLNKIELSLRDYKDHIEEASSIGGKINFNNPLDAIDWLLR